MTDTIYIIHESVPGNDPRLDPKMERIGDFWHYVVQKFPADRDIVWKWLNGEQVTENIAKAYKFTSAYENEISVRKSTNIYEEISGASGDTEDLDETKIYYRLTQVDQQNAVEFFKTVMRIHVKNYTEENSKNAHTLLKMIERAATISECQDLMYDYFDVGFPINVRRKRAPKFQIHWLKST